MMSNWLQPGWGPMRFYRRPEDGRRLSAFLHVAAGLQEPSTVDELRQSAAE